ncbi:hypothetical protein MRX96_011975 [Rhipicephalus microplus]
MGEDSPQSSAMSFVRLLRSLARTTSRRRSATIACTSVPCNVISSANAAWLRHEETQRRCKVVSEKPKILRLLVPAVDAERIARGLTSSMASYPTISTTSSITLAALHTAYSEFPASMAGF